MFRFRRAKNSEERQTNVQKSVKELKRREDTPSIFQRIEKLSRSVTDGSSHYRALSID